MLFTRILVGKRGFNDLVFRVGLATRKDYIVSYRRRLAI